MHQHQICSTSEQWSWLWSLCYCICCRARIKWKFRRKAFRTKFNEKSPVWMFEETGVICFLQQQKNPKEIKELFQAARYLLYLSKAILWGRYGRRRRELYNSLLEAQRLISQKMWLVHSQFFEDEKKQFFGNMLHVNDRLCITFDIKCKLLLDFY